MINTKSQVSVDVVMPNYNSAPYLSETIDSVINQTFKNWRLIIVDGNSNTETQKILENYANHPNINIIWLKKNKKADGIVTICKSRKNPYFNMVEKSKNNFIKISKKLKNNIFFSCIFINSRQ